jgi:hypothetical protein
VGDRWLLLRTGDAARVVDSRTGRGVASAREVAQATLLRDGTLAWIDTSGGVHARRPASEPIALSAAGASRLAGARRAVYWTEAGTPRVYRPPSAARSASKPG